MATVWIYVDTKKRALIGSQILPVAIWRSRLRPDHPLKLAMYKPLSRIAARVPAVRKDTTRRSGCGPSARRFQQRQRMDYFAQQLINGIVLGSIYGLIAIGYTMVYGIVGMINFAMGDIFMIGGFIALIAFLILVAIGSPWFR